VINLGEEWFALDCSIKNIDTESAPISSILMFTLYDADGYSKDRTIFADTEGSLDGELGPGETDAGSTRIRCR